MIITISQSATLGKDNLEYNLEKVRRQDATIIQSQGIKIFHEKDCPDSEHVRKEFMRSLRRGMYPLAKPFTHISINPDPKDQLSVLELREIARTFMDMNGLSSCPHLVFHHHDADHDHLHLLICRMDEKGMRHLSKMTFDCSLLLEDRFGLHKKELRVFKKERLRIQPVDPYEGDLTSQTKGCLRAVQTFYGFKDLDTYMDLAGTRNIHVAVRRGQDLSPKGLSYIVTNDEGRTVSVNLSARSLGTRYALKSVLEMAERNRQKEENPSLLDIKEDLKEEAIRHLESARDIESGLYDLLSRGIELRKARSGSLLLLNHQTGKVERESPNLRDGVMDCLLRKTHLDNSHQVFFLLEDHHRRNESLSHSFLERRIQMMEKKNLRFTI